MTEPTEPSGMTVADHANTAWGTFKTLPRRRKAMVILGVPLWLPVAFVAWLERG